MSAPDMPVAFHFNVDFPLLGVKTPFQEVSGIGTELETEDLAEGGENRFVHKLPKRIKHQNLVLKGAVTEDGSPLVRWCKSVLESEVILPVIAMPLTVMLLDKDAMPMRSWSFSDTYPVKWEVDPFGALKNELAIEKIELSYAYATREV